MPQPERQQPAAFDGAIVWHYSAPELWADGVVHAIGIAAVLTASVLLVLFLAESGVPSAQFAAVGIYLGTLAISVSVSAAYNIWPVTRTKWILRRLDHCAIYLLIAGTYTPFMVSLGAWGMLAAVWLLAAAGIALKLLAPGRFDRLAIALYLALGWSSIVIFRTLVSDLPLVVLWLVAIGGVIYSAGVVFHVLDWRFFNAVWHAFVLVAAGVHFSAVTLLAFNARPA